MMRTWLDRVLYLKNKIHQYPIQKYLGVYIRFQEQSSGPSRRNRTNRYCTVATDKERKFGGCDKRHDGGRIKRENSNVRVPAALQRKRTLYQYFISYNIQRFNILTYWSLLFAILSVLEPLGRWSQEIGGGVVGCRR